MEAKDKSRTSTFNNLSGQKASFRNWMPGDKPKGIIAIVHGLKSHRAFYHPFAPKLSEHDYDAHAIYLPGRGRSKGIWFSVQDYKYQRTEIIRTAQLFGWIISRTRLVSAGNQNSSLDTDFVEATGTLGGAIENNSFSFLSCNCIFKYKKDIVVRVNPRTVVIVSEI